LNKLFDLVFRLKGSVDKVVVTGAANFKVENVKTDLIALSAEVDISLEAARLVGEHYVNNGALPLFGEGRLKYCLLLSQFLYYTLNIQVLYRPCMFKSIKTTH
jgi:hypothetical protein